MSAARVLTGKFSAAALTFALVVGVASVFFGRCTCALSRTCVFTSGSFAFAHVKSTADVRFFHQERDVVCRFAFGSGCSPTPFGGVTTGV